MAAASTRF